MFDRSQSDGPLCVAITLDDGRELKGRFLVPPGRALAEVLNGSASFVEFEPFGGERMFVAKSALRCITPMELAAAPRISAATGGGAFNPFSILGVSNGAEKAEVRQAYLELAKAYHPDRHATTELPAEVHEYLSAMARRINAAYEAIETTWQKQAEREQPVFATSPNRRASDRRQAP